VRGPICPLHARWLASKVARAPHFMKRKKVMLFPRRVSPPVDGARPKRRQHFQALTTQRRGWIFPSRWGWHSVVLGIATELFAEPPEDCSSLAQIRLADLGCELVGPRPLRFLDGAEGGATVGRELGGRRLRFRQPQLPRRFRSQRHWRRPLGWATRQLGGGTAGDPVASARDAVRGVRGATSVDGGRRRRARQRADAPRKRARVEGTDGEPRRRSGMGRRPTARRTKSNRTPACRGKRGGRLRPFPFERRPEPRSIRTSR
jgi:hypothetical protein